MIKYNWNTLLSAARLNHSENNKIRNDQFRTPFEHDSDKLVFSSAFRRLQDKTQVFPMPTSDFIHTRLTHSIEVSSVGRSIASNVANWLYNNGEIEQKQIHDIIEIIRVACLMHDIGNPPFGHSGETAIGEYYTKNLESIEKKYNFKLSDTQSTEVKNFEGNAQGFKIACNLNLTYAVYGAYGKYPYTVAGENKKFGCYDSEKETLIKIVSVLGLKENDRHPLAYIMEAADDICYRVLDLEDAEKLGLIKDFRTLEDLFIDMIVELELNNIDEVRMELKSKLHNLEKMKYFRTQFIHGMILKVTDAFKINHDLIMTGEFKNQSLVDKLDFKITNKLKRLKNITSEYCYNNEKVLKLEFLGKTVIDDTINLFLNSALDFKLHNFDEKQMKKESHFNYKLLVILPDQNKPCKFDSHYQIIQKINNFVSGMTDRYALDLHQKLCGISIPSY